MEVSRKELRVTGEMLGIALYRSLEVSRKELRASHIPVWYTVFVVRSIQEGIESVCGLYCFQSFKEVSRKELRVVLGVR